MIRMADFAPGDPVFYFVTKNTTRPGPRAEDVAPAPQGDTYRYRVKKFWRVAKVLEDGRLELYTRRGKRHVCDVDDRNLAKPSLIGRLWYRKRFPPTDPSEIPAPEEP
jgi:hypothetical protein